MYPSKIPVQELPGRRIECVCGMVHEVSTQGIDFAEGCMARLAKRLPKRVHMVMDGNTRAVAGEDMRRIAEEAGASVTVTELRGDKALGLHADERALGAVLAGLPMDCDMLVGVGSGTINDVTRFVASRARLPYAILGTAPSMDGYASSLSPLLLEGVKLTFPAIAPTYIAGEPGVLASAPKAMVAAGAGDLFAKIVSAVEWRMARDVDDEPYCPEMVAMVDRAVEETLAAVSGLAKGDPTAAARLTEALTVSGLAMQMQGNSRPASGMEHHLSHFWEMALIAGGRDPGLHGDKVGVGTLVAMDMYPRFFGKKRTPLSAEDPHGRRALEHWDALAADAALLGGRRREIEAAIAMLDGPTHPRQLGIDRAGFLDTLLHARDVRPRYSLFNLMDAFGCLEDMAHETAEAWYG